MDRAAVGPPDQAAREHRRALAATLSNRHQRLEPLREALQETIRTFYNEGTAGAAEAIWASLGENWHLEKMETRRDVLRFIELARTEASDRGEHSTTNPLPAVDVLVESCRVEHQTFLVAPPVSIPSYLRSELKSVTHARDKALEVYERCYNLCRYDKCKETIKRIWELHSSSWHTISSHLQTFYLREFARTESTVEWTNLAIDQGFLRPHRTRHSQEQMVGIDVAAQLLLPSKVLYKYVERDLDRMFQLAEKPIDYSDLEKLVNRIIDRYSPQQAHTALDWADILRDHISSSLASSQNTGQSLKEFVEGLVRLWRSPPLSAFDLPTSLTNLVNCRDFSVFGPFLTRLRHSPRLRQGPALPVIQ